MDTPTFPRRYRATRAAALTLAACVLASACSKDKGNDPNGPSGSGDPVHSTIVPSSNSSIVEARTSQIVTDGSPPSTVFDDFTLTAGASIGTVGWQGIYCVQTANAPAPSPTASSFTISFWADAGGQPDVSAPLQTSTYTVAQVGQTFLKNVDGFYCGTAYPTSWNFYNYSVALATPFTATAGTKYWLSIQATTPSYAVYFGWRDGVPDNHLSLQLFQGTFTSYAFDRAYSLAP